MRNRSGLPLFISATLGLLMVPCGCWAVENEARDDAKVKMQCKDWNGAVRLLDQACGLAKEDPQNFMLRGRCFFHLKNWELAITDFDKVLTFAPNYFPAYLWRGSASAKLGKDDLAIKDYEQAIRLNPRLAQRFFRPAGKADGAVAAAQRYHLPGVSPENANSPAAADYKAAMQRVYPSGYSPDAAGRSGEANPGTYATDADDATYLTDLAAGAEPESTDAAPDSARRLSPDSANNQSAGSKHSGHGRHSGDGRQSTDGKRKSSSDNSATDDNADSPARPNKASGDGQGAYQALAADPGASVTTDLAGNLDIGRSDDTLSADKNRRVVPVLDQDPNFGEFGAVPGSQPLKGDPETVIKRCTEAIRRDDKNAEYYYLRAKAFQRLAQVDKAYKDYAQAIYLDPNQAKYYIGRASMFYQLNKPMLVDLDVKRALSVNSELPHNIHFGGEAYPKNVQWSGDGGE